MSTWPEVQGYPKIVAIAPGRVEYVRKLQVPWDDIGAAIAQLSGQPWPYPPYNITPPPICYAFSAQPLAGKIGDAGGGKGSYEYWLLEAIYGSIAIAGDGNGDPLNTVHESLEAFSYENLLPAGDFRYEDAEPVPQEMLPTHSCYGIVYRRTFMRLTAVPTAVFQGIGCVNNAPVAAATLGTVFNTGTLLYGPPEAERVFAPGMLGAWKVTQRFFYRPETWHKVGRIVGGQFQWVGVYSPDDLETPLELYPTANFSIPT